MSPVPRRLQVEDDIKSSREGQWQQDAAGMDSVL